jgi:predicted acyl esterase
LHNSSSTGRNKQEDVIAMLAKYPQFNEYWQDKRAIVENIKVPAYVLASYSTFLHTFGSFRGFEGIQNENKWFVQVESACGYAC